MTANETKPTAEPPLSLAVPRPKAVSETVVAPETTKLAYEQPPITLSEVTSQETSSTMSISPNEAVDTQPRAEEVFSTPQVEINPAVLAPEAYETSIDTEEVTSALNVVVVDQLPLTISEAKVGDDTTAPSPEVTDPFNELLETEVDHSNQAEPLPAYLADFLMLVGTEIEDAESTQEQIDSLIDLPEIEASEEEIKQVTESFIQVVTDVKTILESTSEITETHIETVIVATIQLLELIGIEPSLERVTQIISMSLGEEFVLQHLNLINDCLVDELGTHERRLWAKKTGLINDQIDTSSSILGKIALQLGLRLQLA